MWWWIGPVAALAVLLGVPFVVRGLRRGSGPEPDPVVRWQPDNRPEEERLESYANELLDELNQYGVGPGARQRRREIESRLPW